MTDLTEQPSGKWQRFKAWLHGFEVYQIFVVRAWQRKASRDWYWFMLFPCAAVYICVSLWLQEATTLDELRKDTGVVDSLSIGRNCDSILVLRTDDGALRRYGVCILDKNLPQRIRGKSATVWSVGTMLPPILWGRNVRQLEVGGVLEIEFKLDNEKKAVLFDKALILFFSLLILFALFRIWWANCKAEPDGQKR